MLFCLLGMGALAGWADSEAVLPAYLIGMVLAGTVGRDHALVRRLRTLTFGFIDAVRFHPCGLIRGRSQRLLGRALLAFTFFLVVKKFATKIVGVYPVTKFYWARPTRKRCTRPLLMSTGLTFGTISSLFGLSHGIIDQASVLGAGGRRDRKCGDPDDHRQRLLPATSSVAKKEQASEEPTRAISVRRAASETK